MKPFLRKSRSRWERLLLALCAFFWVGCDNSTDATSSFSSDSNSGNSSSSARTPSSSADSAVGSSSSGAVALSSSSGNSSSEPKSSSSASLDQCTLEYDETLLQEAVDYGAITDKSTCDLSNFIALYGSPAVFDSLEALNARTTLVYEPGVGCFRCPNDESSSSKENNSSSSAVSSSSAEDPASSSSFGSIAPLYGVPMDDFS
ncbi:MAG: hypothetical protein M0P13_07060 [Fibrobacteraceae bacterium]|nr:hypothetical protein [Fibrobacteraceae bacterium]